MNDTIFAAGISALVTAMLSGAIHLINALHKNSQDKRAAQFTEQGRIIDRQERQIARLDGQITELQKIINTLQEEHAKCQVETAELRTYQAALYDYAKQTHQALQKAGVSVGEPPCPPPVREHKVDVGFMVRTGEQNTELVRALSHPNPKEAA